MVPNVPRKHDAVTRTYKTMLYSDARYQCLLEQSTQCSPTPFNRLLTAMLNPVAAIPPPSKKHILKIFSLLHKPFLSIQFRFPFNWSKSSPHWHLNFERSHFFSYSSSACCAVFSRLPISKTPTRTQKSLRKLQPYFTIFYFGII
jgi:hypothetical protein